MIFLALAPFGSIPLGLRFSWKFDYLDFTIWVPPAFMGWCPNHHYSNSSQVVPTLGQVYGAKFRYYLERVAERFYTMGKYEIEEMHGRDGVHSRVC